MPGPKYTVYGHTVSVVEMSKEKIIKKVTKFQIGAIPGHRSAEHLFVIKSIMQLYSMLGKAIIVQLFDISKYFDKESLRDGMDSLYILYFIFNHIHSNVRLLCSTRLSLCTWAILALITITDCIIRYIFLALKWALEC